MSLKHIILGTAGHIDHGKTSLIKALTGVDCDRLKEEKERGITIELGFTYLKLFDGTQIGIIDVPGHERFVHHMVAGVVGMDIVLLVIAADEGIMPQTREHLDICRLLGVKRGLVAITKTDMVEPEWLELATDEIGDFIKDTFLSNAPIIPVSSVTGKGLDRLICAIEELADKVPDRGEEGVFRLPVDRIFTIKGFGTVVTGTLLSGKVGVGEMVEIFPGRIKTKIRGIQVHNEKVEHVRAGQRTAINLQGIDKEELKRGDVISQPGLLEPAYLLDIRLKILEGVPAVKNRMRIRFHSGTTEVFGRVILLDRERLEPGDSCLAQLRLEEKVAVMPNDRYIIRRYSPIITLGGGKIIDSHPEKHKRYKADVLEELFTLEDAPIAQTLESHIKKAGIKGLDLNGLVSRTNLDQRIISVNLAELNQNGEILIFDEINYRVVHNSIYEQIKKRIVDTLRGFYDKNPLKWGMLKEELKARVSPDIDPRLYNRVLEDLEKEGTLLICQDVCAISTHKIVMSSEDKRIYEAVLDIYKKANLTPPNLEDLYKRLRADQKDVKKVIDLLIDESILVRVKGEFIFHRDAIEAIIEQVEKFLEDTKQMSIGDFKGFTGLSRKFAVPLLEYMDAQGKTLRLGDKRILRKK